METDLASSQSQSQSNSNSVSVASRISFNSLAKLFENLSKINALSVKGKDEQKRKELELFVKMWTSTANELNEQQSATQTKISNNFFPALRLLLPSEDRRTYGLKESKLAAFLIKALGLSESSDDAKKLSNFASYHADFGSAAFDVLNKRLLSKTNEKSFSIEEMNKYLDSISSNYARGREGQLEVKNIFLKLIMRMNALQLKWLIRIILKDLKIGIKDATVLEAYHPDAISLYNFTSSLEEVCDKLNDPTKRLNEIAIQLFQPCYPMLGEKAKPNKIENLIGNQTFYIETKYDGERFQLHKSNEKYGYYSRNSHDYTETFGRDPSYGTLTPFIHNAFSKDVKSVILDGEMCGFNSNENILLTSKGEYDVKSNSRYWDHIHTCYVVFDILMYNDHVLTNKPLKERLEYLKKAFANEIEDRIIFSQRELGANNQNVVDALNKAIDNRLEGIVVKDPSSVYKPNVRSGSGWYKVKPDYMLGLNDDLDLLIVGGYFGVGRRAGMLSHFLLAVAVDDENNPSKNDKTINNDDDDLDFEVDSNKTKLTCSSGQSYPKKFYSFCKVGSGYSIQELYDFNLKLKDKWRTFDKKNPPFHLELAYEKPDKWIEPKDSMIVQVKAVEINSTDKYKTGCTLRFPRLEKFRDDKAWHECMKLSELNELREKNDGKLASGKHYDLDDYDEDGNLINDPDYDKQGEPLNKKKKKTNLAKRTTVDTRFKGIDASNVDKLIDVFDGKEFCVVNGDDKHDKKSLEIKITELGGTLVQNPDKETTHCLIASKIIHKIKSYIDRGTYDIVKTDWLLRCYEKKSFEKWKPNDMIFSKDETKRAFAKMYDKYGDSYEEDCSIESLKKTFSNMNDSLFAPRSLDLREQIALCENTYFPDESKNGLFRLENFYLNKFEEAKFSGLKLIESKAKWYGALISENLDKSVTKVIVDKKGDTLELDDFKKLRADRKNKFHIVSSDWINECIQKSRLVDTLPFHL